MSHDLRPLYSVIICSGNQLYSGTGRVIFDWILYSKSYFRFEIVIDAFDPRNFELAKQFCTENELTFEPLRSRPLPGAPDPGLMGVPDYIERRRPAVVEIHSWANSATNFAVLEAIGADTTLVFTPHTQPAWTIPDHQRFYLLKPTFRMALERADLVCCLSPAELQHLADTFGAQPGYWLVGNGVDTNVFRPEVTEETVGVLSISDFKEHRKRNDLLFEAFERAAGANPAVRFTIAGRASTDVELSATLRERTDVLGYVPADTLVALYQRAEVFVLLSDFEAFGIPIAEALCCGTPVVINRTREMAGIFGGMPGVALVDNKDTEACAEAVLAARKTPPRDRETISSAAAERFSFEAVYGTKLRRLLALRGHKKARRVVPSLATVPSPLNIAVLSSAEQERCK